jgi:hypothetical protein
LRFAPHIWLYVVLEHRGRRSGRVFRTPLAGIRVERGFLLPLAFGEKAHWVLNLRHAGGGVVEWRADALSSPTPKLSLGRRANPRSLPCSGGSPRYSEEPSFSASTTSPRARKHALQYRDYLAHGAATPPEKRPPAVIARMLATLNAVLGVATKAGHTYAALQAIIEHSLRASGHS